MGNSNSSHKLHKEPGNSKAAAAEAAPPPLAAKRPSLGMVRSASGSDIQEKPDTQFLPIDKLGKILAKKSEEAHGIHGITRDVFVKYVFPKFPELGIHLFDYLKFAAGIKTDHIGVNAFRLHCEKFLGILDDSIILEKYVIMFGDLKETELIKPENFKDLLRNCYNLSMAHYSDGPQTCRLLERTLNSVVASCFFSKESLSPGYICRWLENNCPRLVPPVHKYSVHALSTSYRTIMDSNMKSNSDTVKKLNPNLENTFGIDLSTPILEKANILAGPGGDVINMNGRRASEEKVKITVQQPLLPLSEAWLLAGALPPLYSRPQALQSAQNATNLLSSNVFMAKLLSVVPSHWAILYDSRLDGQGTNRFLHHVLGYRGPNLVLFRCEENLLFCIASPGEWRETHLYVGGEESCCIQLLPKFIKLENKPKSLYLNTSIRGYPKGLRAGSDPRKPIIIVDEHFETLEFKGIKYQILSIEVWGCGDEQSRTVQLDIKKWEVKEAERQRTVKLTAADWMDHPDRYLLELGGRQNYNNTTK